MEGRRRWGNLETDCLIHIFQRLGMEDLMVSVPFVCSSWYKASLSPLCWQSLDFSQLNLRPWSDFVARFRQQYKLEALSFTSLLRLSVNRSRGSAISLIFPSSDHYTLDDLIYASQQLPAVKIFSVPGIWGECKEHFPNLICKWKYLEQLHMESTPNTFIQILLEISRHCTNFVGLRVKGGLNDDEASALISYLPKIKYLWVRSAFFSKENLIKILQSCKQLEILDLKGCVEFKVDDELLKMASHISRFAYETVDLEKRLEFYSHFDEDFLDFYDTDISYEYEEIYD